MPLVLLDGCEDFSSLPGGGSIVVGRYQNCIRATALTFNFTAAQESDTVTVGFAFRTSYLGTSTSFFNFRSDAGATNHIEVRNTTAGGVQFVRGGATVLVTSASGLIQLNTWCYIEFQVKLHDTLGTAVARINGAVVASYGPGDTKNAGTKTTIDQVTFDDMLSGTTDYDDVYIMAGAGDAFLGSITVETLLPNGNGAVNQWAGSDGDSTNNYQLIDELPPASVDYVYSSTVGQQDLYAMQDLAHTDGTVVGVCHSAYMLRTDSVNARNVKLINRRAFDTKSAAIPLTTAYRSYDYVLTVDPENVAGERIAVTGAPDNSRGGGFAHGVRLHFDTPGVITKIRYQRRSVDSSDLNLYIWQWDTPFSLLGGPYADIGAGATGTYEITLPTPITVPADVVVSIGGTTVPMKSGAATVAPTDNVNYIGAYLGGSGSAFPNAGMTETYFVEPTFVSSSGGPWLIANVNALQSGVELA